MSSNKTPNLNLHSWLGTDMFNYNEMNENFNKLDTEVKATNDRLGTLSALKTSIKSSLVAAVNENVDSIGNLKKKNAAFVSVEEYSSYVNNATATPDWQPAIQQAINDSKLTGGTVVLSKATYDIYSPILLPETTSIMGLSNYTDGTIISYKGTAGLWAIKTSGLHQRNKITNIRLELSGNANGILLGADGVDLPVDGSGNKYTPVQFELASVVVSGIGAAYTGIKTSNASHYNFRDVRIGYGVTAGTGLLIYADNKNSGVATFIDCTLGRVDANSVGLVIDGTKNLDDFLFLGCYFGGQSPVKVGSTSTFVRNVSFIGGHIEGRNIGQTVFMMQLYNVLGGQATGMTFAGFQEEFTHAVAFKGEVTKFNILGSEANGIWNTIYYDNGASLIEDCMLQPSRVTNTDKKDSNGVTIATLDPVEFSSGFSNKNFKFTTRRFITENINVKSLFSVDGVNKEYWGSAPDVGFSHTRGDIVKNTTPTRAKNISHWKCISTGTPGTFQAYGTGWGTTAERPALVTNDAGYSYFDTTLAKLILWNGTAWQV